MNATFFIRPSVRRFFQFTFSSSKRLHAASRSSTETPSLYCQLHCVIALERELEIQETEGEGVEFTDMAETLGFGVSVVVFE